VNKQLRAQLEQESAVHEIVEQLRKKVEGMEAHEAMQNDKWNREHHALLGQVQTATTEAARLRQAAETAEREKMESMQKSNNVVEQLGRELKTLKSQMGGVDALRKERDGLQSQVQLAVAESNRLRQTAEALQRDKTALEGQISGMETSQATVARLQAELLQRSQIIQQQSQQISSLEGMSKQRDSLLADLTRVRGSADLLQRDNMSLKESAEAATQLESKNKELESELRRLKEGQGQNDETAPVNLLRQTQRLHHRVSHSVTKGLLDEDTADKLHEGQQKTLADSLDLNAELLGLLNKVYGEQMERKKEVIPDVVTPHVRVPKLREVEE